jgi:hypothetical protein
MIELISIHIPKTGGQSFYNILQQVYGDELSIYYRRREYEAVMRQHRRFEEGLEDHLKVLHGHLYYKEVKRLHRQTNAKVICWLRDPVERVISNYNFFKSRLERPDLNPEVARLNAHRKEETLLEYAGRRHTRNRMHKFLKGLPLEQLFFIGFLEHYAQDLGRLQEKMGWEEIDIPFLNQGRRQKKESLDTATLKKLESWNRKDIKLYDRARKMAGY